MRNVCITGFGLISSLGNDPETLFNNLIENQCAFKHEPELAELNGLDAHIWAPACEYDSMALARNIRRTMSPMSIMGYHAAKSALDDANLSVNRNENDDVKFNLNTDRSVLMMGSTTGSPIFLENYYRRWIEKNGPKGQLSTSFFKVMNHSVAANTALALNYSGPLIAPGSACSTSSQALVMGMQLIRSGAYDVAIVGGADELHSSSVAVFDIVKAASKNYNNNPQDIPGPFDKNRDGLVVSEGAGVIVLESEEHVRKRGGKVYAQISGGAYYCDGIHMSQPQSEQMAKTMQMALNDAQIDKSDVEYVNAHATSTMLGDYQEAQAISSLFNGQNIHVSSLKGHMGHSLAACGAIEVISIIQMMKNKKIIGNRNVTEVLEGFDDINILTNNMELPLNTAISNNFAFGGMNTSLVVKNLM